MLLSRSEAQHPLMLAGHGAPAPGQAYPPAHAPQQVRHLSRLIRQQGLGHQALQLVAFCC